MAQSAANLVEHVLPVVPLRQFVVTFPFELRARLAYDGKLLAAVTRIAIDSILGFYKRRMRDVFHVVGHGGAVTVMQRVSSDLRLNPHLHSIVLDGVFVPDNGTPVFLPLPDLDTSDLADVLQVIRVPTSFGAVGNAKVHSRRRHHSAGPNPSAGPDPKRPISSSAAFIRTAAIHWRCTSHRANQS
jgi:hypothetical protein